MDPAARPTRKGNYGPRLNHLIDHGPGEAMDPAEIEKLQAQHERRLERIAEDVGRLTHMLCVEETVEAVNAAKVILRSWYERGYDNGDRDGVARCKRGWGFGGEPN